MPITTIAQFKITTTQLLNEKGQLKGPLPDFATPNTLLHLYETMLLAHLFDKKAIALQRTGKMGTYAPICGQEAIGTAIGFALQPDDVFIPYYRDCTTQIQRGVKLSDILAYWGGDERGNQFNNTHDFPICVPIASQCLHAAGVAFALKYKKEAKVALVTLGDGGTSEGDFYEAINAAGHWQLPLVFVINNNQWAISVPRTQQTHAQTLAQKAIAAGILGEQVDGNDILATTQVIQTAVEHARSGKGSYLIEALSYRLSDHTTADDASRYQPPQEVAYYAPQEPLSRFKYYLFEHHHLTPETEKKLQKKCKEHIEKEVADYLNRPKQSVTTMFDYHYATLPHYLIEQRASALDEEAHA